MVVFLLILVYQLLNLESIFFSDLFSFPLIETKFEAMVFEVIFHYLGNTKRIDCLEEINKKQIDKRVRIINRNTDHMV